MRLNELTPIIFAVHIAALCLGCIIGSFLNVVVWRVPRGDSLITPPSHCPNCGHLIRAWENIPVISWLCLRGRCSGCHLPISIRYPLGELATGIGYAVVFYACWRRNLPAAILPAYFFVFGTLICVTQIDVKHRIIPNVITVSGLIIALLLALQLPESRLIFGKDLTNATSGTYIIRMFFQRFADAGYDIATSPILAAFTDYAIGVLFGTLLLGIIAVPARAICRMTHKNITVIGYGDVMFLAMLGGFLGADACLYTLCLGSLIGLLWGLLRLAMTRGKSGSDMPFGPMLSIGALVWMLFGSWWPNLWLWLRN